MKQNTTPNKKNNSDREGYILTSTDCMRRFQHTEHRYKPAETGHQFGIFKPYTTDGYQDVRNTVRKRTKHHHKVGENYSTLEKLCKT